MPKFITPLIVILASLGLIPLALVVNARVSTSKKPRVHFVHDMDHQQKYKPQQPNAAFADGRAMRPPIPGTVARGELMADDHLYRGKIDGKWATTFPMPVTTELMDRGRKRFEVFCASCHGLSGDGRGPVSVKADELEQGTWTPPSSYHTDTIRKREVGHLFNTIGNGLRNMPAHGPQISHADRWAIVAYIRALQRSQNAPIEDVPPEHQEKVR
jgi:mono/diheme cytochrome c family protein